MKSFFHSAGAVFAGFFTVAALSILTDVILESTGVFPPATQGLFTPWMLVLALAYRTAYTVLGGYLTARLAPKNAMKHVKILATIGTFFAVLGLVTTWSLNLGPHWYPIALAVLAFPSVWYGGTLWKGAKARSKKKR